ncbi:hypothetical protein BH10PSE9_BH10PSE9_16010 [soil metagenome]
MMDLRKLTLAVSVASLFAAASPVLADDLTDAQNDPNATGQSGSVTAQGGSVIFLPQVYYRSVPMRYSDEIFAPTQYYADEPMGYYADDAALQTRPLGDVGTPNDSSQN